MDSHTEVGIDSCLWQLDRVRDRLVLSGPYHEELLELMRQVPGRSWDGLGDYGTPKANLFALLPEAAEPLLDLLVAFDIACSEAAFALLITLLEQEPTPIVKRLLVVRDRFVVDAPFDGELLQRARAVRGRFWDAAGSYGIPKSETFPRTHDSVDPLRRLATDFDLEIDPEAEAAFEALEAEHTREVATAQARHQASQATEAHLELPKLGGTLRPFQVAGVAYAIEAKRTFIADEMGLGKTVQALASLEALQAFPALIVTLASLKLNWEREAHHWLPHRSVQVLSAKTDEPEAEVNIINYDVLGWLMTQDKDHIDHPRCPPFQAVVLDESQAIKSHKAKRTRHAMTLGAQAPVRLCLTGTPVLNRPIELVQQLAFLDRLPAFGGFWAFVEQYCEAKRLAFGWDFSGAANLDDLHDRLRGLCYVRRTKQQVLPELPPKQRTVVPIELSNLRDYRQAERQTIKWLAKQAIQDESFLATLASLKRAEQKRLMAKRGQETEQRARRAETLVRLETLKQLSAKGKMKAVKEWITTFLESGEKLLVFAHHQEIVTEIAQQWQAPSITGKTPKRKRQAIVDQFQNDPDLRVLPLNIRAGGLGLTLTAASHVAFIELDWTPAAHDQAEDRCHRIGQRDHVTVWYLLAPNTIDDDIYAVLDHKHEVVSALTDGQNKTQQLSMLHEVIDRLTTKPNTT